MSPMQGKDTEGLGIAFFVSILSSVVNRNTAPCLVVLGQISIHGVLSRVERLGDCLRVAMDSGAKQVMIPTASSAPNLGNIPTELLDKIRIDFFSEPMQAAYKAIAEA